MSNGLEELKEMRDEAVSSICRYIPRQMHKEVTEYFDERKSIVEKELKEKERQDNVLKILKSVIAFEQMPPHIEPNKDNGFNVMSAIRINVQRDIENEERELLRQWVLETCFPKELKALDIIKNKRIDVDTLIYYSKMDVTDDQVCHWYNNYAIDVNEEPRRVLKEEEYGLLKKVLL